jgi:hypothetical protein
VGPTEGRSKILAEQARRFGVTGHKGIGGLTVPGLRHQA